MNNVLMLSQKGGTGKSTIADNLAFMLEDEGHAVTFYDTDPQESAIHATVVYEDADYTIVDTPGVLTDDTRDMLKASDLVIIPTQASMLDMKPLERTRELVAKTVPSVPVLIVINGWNRWSNASNFKEWLEGTLRPTEHLAILSQSDMIRQAANEGLSVVSYAPNSRPARELIEILEQVKGLLGVEARSGN